MRRDVIFLHLCSMVVLCSVDRHYFCCVYRLLVVGLYFGGPEYSHVILDVGILRVQWPSLLCCKPHKSVSTITSYISLS